MQSSGTGLTDEQATGIEPTYFAGPYAPMPCERWAVWKRLKRYNRIVLLVPDKQFAKEFAEDVADAFNEHDEVFKIK